MTLTRICDHFTFPLRRCPHCGMGIDLEDFLPMTQPIQIVTATGAHDFQVEIAADDASREHGLRNRQSMPPNYGMLFEFDSEAPRTFNMRRVYIPLDIIFLSQDWLVTRIVANAEPQSERPIPSGGSCVAVLELNGGTAAKIGLKTGDEVKRGGDIMTKVPPRDDPIWQTWARRSPHVQDMLESGEPLTRDRWLRRNYVFDDVPDQIPPEVEDMMPPPFRRQG